MAYCASSGSITHFEADPTNPFFFFGGGGGGVACEKAQKNQNPRTGFTGNAVQKSPVSPKSLHTKPGETFLWWTSVSQDFFFLAHGFGSVVCR